MRANTSDILEMYTIYCHPADYPQGYVVRRSEIRPEAIEPREAHTAPDLASARALVPRGLFRMRPCADDDPAITEVWV
jgi:hypothetical protein